LPCHYRLNWLEPKMSGTLKLLMNISRVISTLVLICLLSHEAAAQEPNPLPMAAGACTIVGPLLGPSDFGIAAGLPLADTSAVLLEDGRVRMYMFAQDRGIVSAVSLTAEGVSFVAEEGERLPDGSGMPRVVAIPTGGLRLFYTSGDGIQSATSEDGLTFTVEPGFRITAEEAGFSGATAGGATSGATVVQLADGRYRMYFSDLPRPGDPPGGHRVKSAVSTDQLAWTVEEGVRLGPGAPVLTDSAEHPFALANPDGTVTLYYGKFPGPGSASTEGVYESTSADGLTFEQETYDVFFGNDPDALRLMDGSLVVYYGQFDPAVGGTINVARCTDPSPDLSPTPTPTSNVGVARILPGGSLSSPGGQYRLVYQRDGNLVLSEVQLGTALWATGTGGTAPGQATVQSDGNFVIYDAAGSALWTAGTAGNPGAYLRIQDDGNVVIYGANAQPIWSRLTGSLLPD